MNDRLAIARRAARDLPTHGVVNLGRGLPTEVADHIPATGTIMLHSENGILGCGPAPATDRRLAWLTDASKRPVSIVPGGSVFDLVESFDMIRGGHVDLVLLGGFEVSMSGDLANWALEREGKVPPAVGGAMDLASACRDVWVLMTHHDPAGAPKLVNRCRYPLTATGVVTRVYTELGIFQPSGDAFRILERAVGVTVEMLETACGAPLVGVEDAPVRGIDDPP